MADYVNDGNGSFEGGQNDGLAPDRIAPNQYQKAVNVTTRGSTISPRPGFVHKDFTVLTQGKIGGRTYEQIFRSGKFQGAASYDADNGVFVVCVFSGVLFRLDPKSLTAEVIFIGKESDGDRMSQFRRRIPWSYAGRFLVWFDYPNLPVIIENQDARRANPDRESFPGVPLPEIPTSVLGAYVQNRMWVANAVNEFTASDPVGGINADAPLTFEEVFAAAAPFFDQIFTLGSQSKNQPITAMGFLQVPDTSTGVGPLIVATKNALYAHRSDLPRAQWEETAFGRLILYNAGIPGPRAFTNQNSDLVFLSGDNQARSLLLQRSNQERWENAPLSREVRGWFEDYADRDLLDIGVVASHGNRIFFTVAPYRTSALSLGGKPVADYAHAALAVLELDNISGLGKGSSPAWAGIWTGVSPMEIVVLNEGPYIFSKDDGGANRIYFVDDSITWDVFDGKEKDIYCRVYTREYDFQSKFQDKKVGSVDYSFSNIAGKFSLLAEYRPGNSKNWTRWGCFQHEAITETCEATCHGQEEVVPILDTQAFREMNLGDPVEKSCDPLTGEESTVVRTVGLRLTIKGKSWTLGDIRLRFEMMPDTDQPATQRCDYLHKGVIADCEPNDWELHRTATRDAEWPSLTSTL